MTIIRENTKNGKVISYRFTACMERDVRGRQIRKYTTWTPPAGLTAAKAKKAADRASSVCRKQECYLKVGVVNQKTLLCAVPALGI